MSSNRNSSSSPCPVGCKLKAASTLLTLKLNLRLNFNKKIISKCKEWESEDQISEDRKLSFSVDKQIDQMMEIKSDNLNPIRGYFGT